MSEGKVMQTGTTGEQAKTKVGVQGVPETMLQTLFARAAESEKENHHIYDKKAIEIVSQLDYDFSKAESDKLMSSGVIARTIVLDRLVNDYLTKHPDAIVVNIACGLDTRCYRMKDIRKEIVENQRLEAVISMPSGVFKPYAGVSTAILVFTKTEHGGTDNVWFYDMTADGFSLDDKRSPISENDIPDIIERFRNLDKEMDRKRTDKSFMVPKQDIVDNAYDLSINKYKEIEYVAVEYPPTSEIMANIREIEMEIGKEMDELERLLKE